MTDPTSESTRRRSIAEALVGSMDRSAGPRAAMVTGSAGVGIADRYSDLDLIVYYDQLPSPDAAQEWNPGLGTISAGPDISEQSVALTLSVEDVECQVGAIRTDVADGWVHQLMAGEDAGSALLQKVADGILHGHVLRDDGVLGAWRRRLAAFPDALAASMAEHHLAAIWPYWRFQENLSHRDALLWETEELVQCAFHILGALSAANRQYYTSFQFKRMRRHIALFRAAPDGLARRLESILVADKPAAAGELRALVEETAEVVERELPRVDTRRIRRDLRT